MSLSMIEKGAEIQFKGQFCKVIINDKRYSIGYMHGNLYKMNSEPIESCCFGSSGDKDSSPSLWHYLYGHLGYESLRLLNDKYMVNGLSLNPKGKFDHIFASKILKTSTIKLI